MYDTVEFVKYVLLDKYVINEYEYYFYLNNDKVKADNCFSNLYGHSYCKLGGQTYYNVPYDKYVVNSIEKEGLCLLPFLLAVLFFYLFFKVFKAFKEVGGFSL